MSISLEDTKVKFGFISTIKERDELAEIILESFFYADDMAMALKMEKTQFKTLYRQEVRDDLEKSMKIGMILTASINGDLALAVSSCDVKDLQLAPMAKAYIEPFEPYERIMNSLLTLIKDSNKRGEMFYFQYLVRNPKLEVLKDFRMTFRLLSVFASAMHYKRGYKGSYFIPISKSRNLLIGSWDSNIVATINLRNLMYGDKFPFNSMDLQLPLVRVMFDDIKNLLTRKIDFLENAEKVEEIRAKL